jgi:hypothetical protein
MKKLLFWVIAIIVVIVFVSAVGGGEETVSEPTTQAETEATPKEEKPKEAVTKENYDKIKQGDSLTGEGGMSIDEVIAILGEPDSKMESSYDDGNGNTVKTDDFTWTNSDFSSVSVSFTNGHVSHKMWME